MEEMLYKEYKGLQRRGLKVKGWCFKVRGQRINPLDFLSLVYTEEFHQVQASK